MKMFKGVLILISILLVAATMVGQNVAPLPAGIDISGSCFPPRHQDVGLGTAAGMLVDYGGIPINEAARIYALTWPANRMTVREQQCMGYVPPYMYIAPGNYRLWEDRESVHAAIARHQELCLCCRGRTDDMARRPPPSAGECGTHLSRICHGQFRRRHPDGTKQRT